MENTQQKVRENLQGCSVRSLTKQCTLALASGHLAAGKVMAGLAESNVNLPPRL